MTEAKHHKGIIKTQPVIMCGGSGTRMWPLSRAGFPKQFICLDGEKSLFQSAAQRVMGLAHEGIEVAAPLIVSNEEHRFLVTEQLREVNILLGAALLEPEGRNTAPALTLAALAAQEDQQDPVLIVTPADQLITQDRAFQKAMHSGIAYAAQGGIAILGVRPTYAETGYGYIHVDSKDPSTALYNVAAFVEKPDSARAEIYAQSENYFWNAGIFLMKASVWLAALGALRPDILEATRNSWAGRQMDENFVRPSKAEFLNIAAESIDYAVLEKCSAHGYPIKMAILEAGWSDLGSWEALWKILPKDDHGNAQIGDAYMHACENTMVHANHRFVAAMGVQDLVIVETSDAILVTHKNHSQHVKNIVATLDQQARTEHIVHRKVYRPWGWYDSVDEGDSFKVKRICVKPGASLSLQKHSKRAEHWIVVRGTAEVISGDTTIRLAENQSTYIALGQMHRLSNPADVPLEIIEVQTGTYLGEDDIERFDDLYGRHA